MKSITIVLFVSLAFSLSAFATNIEKLFKKYAKVAEPSRKTIRESLGHHYVYTREDIERMGAYRLIDLLRALPLGTMLPNLFGFSVYNFAGTYQYVPYYIKLYINDHEVSSLYFGSPFVVWEDIPLDNINHVEVYFLSGAISLGNEPAGIIIKMYTKDPKKENVLLTLRGGVSVRSGYDGSIVLTHAPDKNLSYLIMFNQKFRERKDLSINGKKIKRDGLNRYIFSSIRYKRFTIEFGEGYINRYPFFGLSLDHSPDRGKVKINERFISLAHTFLDDNSLKIVFSIDNNYRNYYEYNQNLIYIPAFWDNEHIYNNPVFYYESINFFKYNVSVSKLFRTKKHDFLFSFNYKHYDYQIRERKYETVIGESIRHKYITPLTSERVFSVSFEDTFKITHQNLLLLTLRYDIYSRNGGFKDYREPILRIGYLSRYKDKLTYKIFLQRYYFAPFFYHIDFAGKDLDTTKIPIYISTEVVYESKGNVYRIMLGHAKLKDVFIMHPETMKFFNLDKDIYTNLFNLNYIKKLNKSKVELNYFKVSTNYYTSPTEGGHIKYMRFTEKYDFYTELIYRNKAKFDFIPAIKVKDSLDLNVSFRYKIDKRKSIVIRGQNLFNKGVKYPFFNPATNQTIYVPTFDRNVYVYYEMHI